LAPIAVVSLSIHSTIAHPPPEYTNKTAGNHSMQALSFAKLPITTYQSTTTKEEANKNPC
jgi:hypothetical protein